MDRILNELTCSVCLDIFSDPYLLPCGHSFCLTCVQGLRDATDFRCPDCRRDCGKLRDVVKNFKLANIVEACNGQEKSQSSRPQIPRNINEMYLKYGLLVMVVSLVIIFLVIYAPSRQSTVDISEVEPLDYTPQLQNSQMVYDETTHGHFLTDVVHSLINLVKVVLYWCLWAIISSLLMLWNSMWYLISSLYFDPRQRANGIRDQGKRLVSTVCLSVTRSVAPPRSSMEEDFGAEGLHPTGSRVQIPAGGEGEGKGQSAVSGVPLSLALRCTSLSSLQTQLCAQAAACKQPVVSLTVNKATLQTSVEDSTPYNRLYP
ncbi:hypothetical protein AAFF_G00097620 [Aldrovandia affinis]|uniref:RING-type domain-containing protein n=1 Tax=Aldrovandia affinis TaxID=143900 RepID=A0AAD7RV99_9TELE|nr:hypothetical protein AAFF_G00097620 [Aldrovandia affinis]